MEVDYSKDPNRPDVGQFLQFYDKTYLVQKVEMVSLIEMAEGVQNNTLVPGDYDELLFHNSIGPQMLWAIWCVEVTRDSRFNGGAGAILCSDCGDIIKEGLTQEEIDDKRPMFCDKCKPKVMIR